MWNVLIVEDDAQTRGFFAESVARHPALDLVASVGSVAQAQAWFEQAGVRVDVLLVDLGLPDGSGLQVIRHARRLHPECEPLVISMFGDADSVLASIEAGALGYIHKDSTPENVANTIVEMKQGASPISPMIARRVLAKFQSLQAVQITQLADSRLPGGSQAAGGLLSGKEQKVLALLARGFSYAEVARLEAISVHTVRTHVKNLYAKLAVHSKSEAVYEAVRLGLLPGYGGDADR